MTADTAAAWHPLPFDGPLDFELLLGYFARRAIGGVEEVDLATGTYRRSIHVDGRDGLLEVRSAGPDALRFRTDVEGADAAVLAPRVRAIFALDADPDPARAHLARDAALAPLITSRPGLRVPGTWDGFETGVRAIVGQQVSVAGASTVTARIVARTGPALRDGVGGVTRRFPRPDELAAADLDGIGMPGARVAAVQGYAAAVARGSIDLDRAAALDDLVGSICQIRGLGPWTAHYIALRLGHADAFPESDLGLRRALDPAAAMPTRELAARAESWRPWRALAAVHLWTSEGA